MAETLVVEDVLRRMQELTDDLQTIRASIYKHIFQPGKALSVEKVLIVSSNSEIIAEFHKTLDDLRHVMWLCVQTAALTARGDAAAQSKLLERATQILCTLSLHPPLPRPDPAVVKASFVGRLLQLIEAPMNPGSEAPCVMTGQK
jgi:hypothetical protein